MTKSLSVHLWNKWLWNLLLLQLRPSKHLSVFKTTWSRLQDMSWRCLQHVFSVTILRLARRLEYGRRFPDLSQDVLKTSWKTKNCYAKDVLKTSWRDVLKTTWRHILKKSWRHILKMSSRRFGGKENVYWWYLYLTNLNVYLTNLCFTNLYLTNLRRIQNESLRTQ